MVLADTGYWLALANSRDRWHGAAVAAPRRLDEALVVTWPVITETCHLLLSRLGVRAELRFIGQMSRNVEIHEIGQGHLDAVHALDDQVGAVSRALQGGVRRHARPRFGSVPEGSGHACRGGARPRGPVSLSLTARLPSLRRGASERMRA